MLNYVSNGYAMASRLATGRTWHNHNRRSGPRHPNRRSDGGDDTGGGAGGGEVIFSLSQGSRRDGIVRHPNFNRVSSRAAQTARDLTNTVLITQIKLCDHRVKQGSLTALSYVQCM